MRLFESERRGWILVSVVLLIGLLCVFMTATWALRFSPSWRLAADMRSHLDPDSDYLTLRPGGGIQPVDPSILTQPVWINFFLTPGATQTVTISTQASLSTPTPAQPTDVPAKTSTATLVNSVPSNTPTLIPTLPASTATATKTSTAIAVVTGTSTPKKTATQRGTVPPTSTSTLAPKKTPIPTVTATASPTPTRTSTRSATATATSTATRTPTPTGTFTAASTPSSTSASTDTARPEADLQITMTDYATDYKGGIPVQYTIVVSNPLGPAGVTVAPVTSSFSANLINITWVCTASGSASCTSDGVGNISDAVNLSVGASVIYTVDATVVDSPSGDLISVASVGAPSGIIDTNPSNNLATDTDQLVMSSTSRRGRRG